MDFFKKIFGSSGEESREEERLPQKAEVPDETEDKSEPQEGGGTMATVKEMEKLLAQVVKDNGLEGAVIADLEGLPIASYLPAEMDEDEIAAASAAILAISDSKLAEGGKGSVVQASIEAENGYLVIKPIGEEYVVSVLAPKDAKLGIILSAVRSIEKKI
jgi:predicted regulator of Ras-like GTPase activity (Roadblock/LC7/MglB family)